MKFMKYCVHSEFLTLVEMVSLVDKKRSRFYQWYQCYQHMAANDADRLYIRSAPLVSPMQMVGFLMQIVGFLSDTVIMVRIRIIFNLLGSGNEPSIISIFQKKYSFLFP